MGIKAEFQMLRLFLCIAAAKGTLRCSNSITVLFKAKVNLVISNKNNTITHQQHLV